MAARKIYNEVVIDAKKGVESGEWETLSEDSFMYEGDMALCGGGGGGGKGGSAPKYTPPPPPLPTPEYVETEAEAPESREDERSRRRRAGAQRGILTTPLGTVSGGLGSSGGM